MRHVRNRSRAALLACTAAAACSLAATPAHAALNFIYICFNMPDGSIKCKAGWTGADCAFLNLSPSVAYCDTLFTALVSPPGGGGFGAGYAPAFDRAVGIGSTIPASTSEPQTHIALGYYPAADAFNGGTFDTTFFAVRSGPAGSPNTFAPIPVHLDALDPTADSIVITAVLAGEPVTGTFDTQPTTQSGTSDITLVFQTFSSTSPAQAIDTVLIPVDLASLTFIDAALAPPACTGDCDRSGAVNFSDITAVLANFGAAYPVGVPTTGDAQGDRAVNFSDVTSVLANFGASCGSTAP
jgi:hypothetical protein